MNLTELKRLAEAATVGPWITWEDVNGRSQVGASTNYTVAQIMNTPLGEGKSNALYLAAASPDVVLSMIAEIDRLRSDVLAAQNKQQTALEGEAQAKADNRTLRTQNQALVEAMDSQKNEWLSWHEKRQQLESDAKRYQWWAGVIASGDIEPLEQAFVTFEYAEKTTKEAIDSALDLAITQAEGGV